MREKLTKAQIEYLIRQCEAAERHVMALDTGRRLVEEAIEGEEREERGHRRRGRAFGAGAGAYRTSLARAARLVAWGHVARMLVGRMAELADGEGTSLLGIDQIEGVRWTVVLARAAGVLIADRLWRDRSAPGWGAYMMAADVDWIALSAFDYTQICNDGGA